MRALAAVAVVAVALSGCTLLLDVDAVWRSRDAGPPVEEVDAGPDFQPEICGNITPLRCVTFAAESGTGRYMSSNAAAIDGGFLLAIERAAPHRVELFALDAAGFKGPLASWLLVSASTLSNLVVAGNGEAWAVAWVQPASGTDTATSVSCASGASLASMPDAGLTAVSSPSVHFVSVAVNAAGDVALGGADSPSAYWTGYPTMRHGLGVGGCPTTLLDTPGGMATYSPGVASVSDGGFWLTGTGSGFSVYGPVGGTFAEATHLSGLQGYEQATAASSDGKFLHTAFLFENGSLFGGDGGVALTIRPANIAQSPPVLSAAVDLFPSLQPLYFSNSACGPGCMVTALLEDYAPTPNLMVAFTDDRGTVTGRGSTYYSVSCGKSPLVNGANVAYSQGLVGVLYTDPTHANFYLCQMPTF